MDMSVLHNEISVSASSIQSQNNRAWQLAMSYDDWERESPDLRDAFVEILDRTREVEQRVRELLDGLVARALDNSGPGTVLGSTYRRSDISDGHESPSVGSGDSLRVSAPGASLDPSVSGAPNTTG
jgi:hypothetical protein